MSIWMSGSFQVFLHHSSSFFNLLTPEVKKQAFMVTLNANESLTQWIILCFSNQKKTCLIQCHISLISTSEKITCHIKMHSEVHHFCGRKNLEVCHQMQVGKIFVNKDHHATKPMFIEKLWGKTWHRDVIWHVW